jgi:acyl carrier protein
MRNLKSETTIETVVAIVQDLTQDWGLEYDAPIGADTMLAKDLQFASVDIIQLCVALEECHGCRLGFQDLLMKDGSYVGDLSLGHMSAFVDIKLNHAGSKL